MYIKERESITEEYLSKPKCLRIIYINIDNTAYLS